MQKNAWGGAGEARIIFEAVPPGRFLFEPCLMVFDVDCITFEISLNGFIEFACSCLWICVFELGPTGEKLARKHWNSSCLFAGQTIASAALRWDHYLFRLTRRCGLQVKRKKIEPCSRIFPCWLTLAAAPWVSRTACSCLFRKSYRFPATFNSKRNTSQSVVGESTASKPSPLDKKRVPISGEPSVFLGAEASCWKRVWFLICAFLLVMMGFDLFRFLIVFLCLRCRVLLFLEKH